MIGNVDALIGLKMIPSGSVDLCVTDPPYPVISGGITGPDRPRGMLSANDGKIFDHNDCAIEDWAPEVFRVLKDPAHCYVFTNEFNRRRTEDALIAAGFRIHKLLVWKKQNVTPNRWYMSNCEFVFFARKGRAFTINDSGSKVVEDRFKNPTRNKLHPTEKPVDLMRHYILNSSQPGDVVLDPFCGAGATGVAALSNGRRFIGFEIDPKYHAIAMERLTPWRDAV